MISSTGRGGAGSSSCATDASEAGVEQCAQRRLTEVPGEVALLGAPQDGGGVKFPHARRNHGSPKRVAGVKPGKDDRIGLAIEHRVDILELDAAARQFGPIGRFRHIRFGAEQMRRFDHRLLEGQMLERVQSVVMNENADRALHREAGAPTCSTALEQSIPPATARNGPRSVIDAC